MIICPLVYDVVDGPVDPACGVGAVEGMVAGLHVSKCCFCIYSVKDVGNMYIRSRGSLGSRIPGPWLGSGVRTRFVRSGMSWDQWVVLVVLWMGRPAELSKNSVVRRDNSPIVVGRGNPREIAAETCLQE